MSMYAVVGLVLVVLVVFLLWKRRANSRTGSPPVKEEPISPQEPTHKVEPAPTEYTVTIYKDGVPMKGRAKEMPQGLQCFDEHGNIVVDVTDRLTKILGSFETHGRNGSITDDRLEGMDYWVVPEYSTMPFEALGPNNWALPVVARVGNTLSWVYQARAVPLKFFYGAY